MTEEKKINDGGPAFPDPHTKSIIDYEGRRSCPTGLTKREWFAGMALQGLISNEHFIYAAEKIAKKGEKSNYYARMSFELADAMIREGEKKP